MAQLAQEERPVPMIDASRCTGCGLCIRICSTQSLAMRDGLAVVTDPDACIYTGNCERICPTQAISRPFQILFNPRKAEPMKPIWYPNWQEKAVFSPDGPVPSLLVENEQLKVIIGCLEPGQKIPSHPEALAVYTFLEGTGWMTVDDERRSVSSGAIVVTPHGAKRSVEAETRLVFLATRIA